MIGKNIVQKFSSSTLRQAHFENTGYNICKSLYSGQNIEKILIMNKEQKKKFFVENVTKNLLDGGPEFLANETVLTTLYPHFSISKKAFANGGKVVVQDLNSRTNLMGIIEYHLLNTIDQNTLKIKNITWLDEASKIQPEYSMHTRQKHCDAIVEYDFGRKKGLDVKIGTLKLDNRCTLNPLIVSEKNNCFTGILVDPIPTETFFLIKSEQYKELLRHTEDKEIFNIANYIIRSLENPRISLTEKLKIIEYQQINLIQIAHQKNLPCWFNNDFFYITQHEFEQHLRTKVLHKFERPFENLATKKRILIDIIRENDPSILKNMKMLKGDKVWETPLIDLIDKAFQISSTWPI